MSLILSFIAAAVVLWLAVTVFNSFGRTQVMITVAATEITPVLYPMRRGGRAFIPFCDYRHVLTSDKIAGVGVYLVRT